MKNQRYNALYEKNKEILAIENNAITLKSASVLYNAFMEEAKILDSIVMRIRSFALKIKPDVLENINLLIPATSALDKFDDIISDTTNIPKMIYVYYNIQPITYENIMVFVNLYKRDLKSFINIDPNTGITQDPFHRNDSANYLKEIAMERANTANDLLEMEEVRVITPSKLHSISLFFKQKSRFLSTIVRDFKTFQFYLRQFSRIKELTEAIKPKELVNGNILVGNIDKEIDFNTYFAIYKHFSAMLRYLINIVAYHESKFYTKIYGLQANIESYTSIINAVLDHTESRNTNKSSDNSINEAYYDGYINSDELDAHNLINGNHAAHMLLYDNAEDIREEDRDEIIIPQDNIKDIKEESISNFEEHEYPYGKEGLSICTLRDTLNI